jgi:hypothetical protein
MALSWTIADYMETVARECSITPPSAWIAATDTNTVLLKTYLKDTVRDIIGRHDWNQLNRNQVITGTDTGTYALASDYLRLAKSDNAVFENSPNRQPVTPITKNGDWAELEEYNAAGAQRFYRLQGSDIEFFRDLPTDAEVTVSYISKNWLTASDGSSPASTWTNDADLSLLPGPLLQLGVIWRFKRHKGLFYADFKAEFESEFARAMSDDRSPGKISTDRPRSMPKGPWDIPVPDFIPSS